MKQSLRSNWLFACLPGVACFALLICNITNCNAQDTGFRTWSDANGKFKVEAKLVEVVDGVAILESRDGKGYRIPVEKLSKADQKALEPSENPFEVFEDAATATARNKKTTKQNDAPKSSVPANGTPSTSETKSTGSGASGKVVLEYDWHQPKSIDWESVPTPNLENSDAWNLSIESEKDPLDLKKIVLPGLQQRFENVTNIVADVASKRSVVGYAADFGNKQPGTRLILIDHASGKSVGTEIIPANMKPVAFLGSKSTFVMLGNQDIFHGNGKSESNKLLEVWKLSGKKVIRSGLWEPFESDVKPTDPTRGKMIDVQLVGDDCIVTLDNRCHVAAWNLKTREPLWHFRMGQETAIAVSPDRKYVAVLDDSRVSVIEGMTGNVAGAINLPNVIGIHWPRLAWSPSGKQLAVYVNTGIHVIDTATGELARQVELVSMAPRTKGFSFPDENCVLLDNELLIDLDSQVHLCDYVGANSTTMLGTSLLAVVQEEKSGALIPCKLPDARAKNLVKSLAKNPTFFPIHPDAAVGIDVTKVPSQHQTEAKNGVMNALKESGLKWSDSSNVKLVVEVEGPKQETVSYFQLGQRQVNVYTTKFSIQQNGQVIWSTMGNNVPGVIFTRSGQSADQVLADAGAKPNLGMLANIRIPKYIPPPAKTVEGNRQSTAVGQAKITQRGIEWQTTAP